MSKNAIINLMLVLLCLANSAAIAKQTAGEYYIGADVMVRQMDYSKHKGQGLMKKNNPGLSIYGGMYLNDNLAFEVGFDYVHNRTRSVIAGRGDRFLDEGLMDPIGCLSEYNVIKAKQHSLHFSIVGFSDYCWDRVQFIGSLGFSALYLKAKHMIPWCNTAAGLHHVNLNQHIVSKHRYTLAPRLSIGLQFDVNDSVKIRAQAIWEQTSRIGVMNDDHKDNRYYKLKPKDTISYSIGVIKELH